MANEKVEINVVFKADVASLKDISKHVRTLQKETETLGATGFTAFEKMNKGVKQLNEQMDFTFLTFLFAGMAMERFGSSIIKSLFSTYSMVHNQQGKLNKDILQMRASFEYLKYSIVSALEGSRLWEGFKNVVVLIGDKLGNFLTKHPNWSVGFIAAAAAIAAIGTAAVAIGTIIQTGELIASLGKLPGITARLLSTGIGYGFTVGSLLKGGLAIGITFALSEVIGTTFNLDRFTKNIADVLGVSATAIGIAGKLPMTHAMLLGVGVSLGFAGGVKLGEWLSEQFASTDIGKMVVDKIFQPMRNKIDQLASSSDSNILERSIGQILRKTLIVDVKYNVT